MASGPEHYTHAEDLLRQAEVVLNSAGRHAADEARAEAVAVATIAQAHASLALVAATIEAAHEPGNGATWTAVLS